MAHEYKILNNEYWFNKKYENIRENKNLSLDKIYRIYQLEKKIFFIIDNKNVSKDIKYKISRIKYNNFPEFIISVQKQDIKKNECDNMYPSKVNINVNNLNTYYCRNIFSDLIAKHEKIVIIPKQAIKLLWIIDEKTIFHAEMTKSKENAVISERIKCELCVIDVELCVHGWYKSKSDMCAFYIKFIEGSCNINSQLFGDKTTTIENKFKCINKYRGGDDFCNKKKIFKHLKKYGNLAIEISITKSHD